MYWGSQLIVAIVFFISVPISGVLSQETSNPEISFAQQSYEKFFVKSTLNGSIYQPPFQKIEGSIFYGNKQLYQGNVLYDSVLYRDKALQYDIYQDQILMEQNTPGSSFLIILDQEQVQEFSLGPDLFLVHSGDLLPKGVYKLAYHSPVYRVMIKYEKTLRVNNTQRINELRSDQRFYLIKDNSVTRIQNKKDIFTVFGKGQEVKSALKSSRIRFKGPEMESSLISFLTKMDTSK